MRIVLLCSLFLCSALSAACRKETVVEYQTIIRHDTVRVSVHDTLFIPSAVSDTVTTLIILRHAEREAQGNDPALSAAGRTRAEELARILTDVNVSRIYSTPFSRTRQTVEPLAESKGLGITEYSTSLSAGQLISQIVAENKNRTVVVAGHSNTVPELLKALSKNAFSVQIAESQYDNLFIAGLYTEQPRILHLKYGTPTP